MTTLKDVCRVLLGLFLLGLFVKGTITDGQVWVEEIIKGPFYKHLYFVFTDLLSIIIFVVLLLQRSLKEDLGIQKEIIALKLVTAPPADIPQ